MSITNLIRPLLIKTNLYETVYKVTDALGLHDDISMRTIRKYLQTETPVILEIGSSKGQDTERMLKAFHYPRIFCFDPDPRIKSHWFLKKFCTFGKFIRYEKIALCNTDGKIPLRISLGKVNHVLGKNEIAEWDLSSTIKTPTKNYKKEFPWINFDTWIWVKCSKLDTWTKRGMKDLRRGGFTFIDFIWMDVEGAEKDVIQGGTETLRKTRYMYLECHDKKLFEEQSSIDDIMALLPNWKIIGKFNNNYLLENGDLK